MIQTAALANRAQFVAATKFAARVVERRSVPVLACARLRAATGRALMVESSDLDQHLLSELPDSIADQNFDAIIPAHTLLDLAGRSAEQDIGFTRDAGGARFHAGAMEAALLPVPADDWPHMGFDPALTGDFLISREALDTALATCESSISTEETRYYLNGIFMHVTTAADGALVLRFVSTDGHRMAIHDLPAPEGASEAMTPAIIPRKAVATLRHLLKPTFEGRGKARRCTSPDRIRVEVNHAKIRFTIGPHTFITKLIDGTFPDYRRVLPRVSRHVTFDRDSMQIAMDQVRSVCSERGRAVALDMSTAGMTLRVQNPDLGSASAFVPADWVGEPMTVGVNHGYLMRFLDLLPPGPVSVGFDDPGAPMQIISENSTFIIMPMRV